MQIDTSERAKKKKIFVYHVNDHQRITLTEEDFNNQMDSMTHSVDTGQPLSLATHDITQ